MIVFVLVMVMAFAVMILLSVFRVVVSSLLLMMVGFGC